MKPELFKDFLDFLFPRYCICCNGLLYRYEKNVCLPCTAELPKTGFHKHTENKVHELFWGRVQIVTATAYLYFNQGNKTQQLLHHLKYKGQKDLGISLGYDFGLDIKDSTFRSIDYIVPIPLHPQRLKARGYNQSALIAEGLARALNKPVLKNVLFRDIETSTQTKKSRYRRWQNVEKIFSVKTEQLSVNDHILLVDDVVTTGSTIESAAQTLKSATNVDISVATLAVALNY